jgi:hypothetical protein
MKAALDAILQAAAQPYDRASVKTDNSFLLIYPPALELDFRDMINDQCLPALQSKGVPHSVLDLQGFLFECFSDEEMQDLESDEFRNYRLMRQGLAARAESKLLSRIREIGANQAGHNLFIVSTASLFPLVRYGEVLKQTRELPLRVFLAFPGEEIGGQPHFLGREDGGNYLAVKISIRG